MSDTEVIAAVAGAAVVAVASLIVAFLSAITARRNDARSAHRSVLGPSLGGLGEHVPGVLATATVYNRRNATGQDLVAWRARMESHAEALKELRSQVRYPLFGADEGLRTLARLASWIQHYNGDPNAGEQLLRAADQLRRRLDRVIARSYRRGEPPTSRDRRGVASLAADVRRQWERHMGRSGPEATGIDDLDL